MQRLEQRIGIAVFSGLITCLAISYSLKSSQQIVQPAGAETIALDSAKEKISQSKIINLNAATRYELTKLPGIGPKLAERIVEYRDAHGSFSFPEEIMRVKGIGDKKYQAMADMITVSD
jgi:comEA protein